MSKMDYTDIIGRRFGRLTVLEYEGIRSSFNEGHGRSYYKCACDCGKEVTVQRHCLLNGRRSSCGVCFSIVDEGNWYRYYDLNGASFIFDPCDLQLVQSHRWRIDDYGYPVSQINGRNYRLPRLIIEPDEDFLVDHINGDPADNRRENLRVAKSIDNQRNMRIPKHNTSGFKGVSFVKEKRRYKAQISINDRSKHIGYFDTPEEAARAYDEAARFFFGEFACVNFPRDGEQGCRRNTEKRVEESA
mgnify:CR=1 FL=1